MRIAAFAADRRRGVVARHLLRLPRRDARRAVRKAYRRILRRAIALGVPREGGQTPETYAEVLSARYPEERAPLETLTTAYDTARYGVDLPSVEQVQRKDCSTVLRGVASRPHSRPQPARGTDQDPDSQRH